MLYHIHTTKVFNEKIIHFIMAHPVEEGAIKVKKDALFYLDMLASEFKCATGDSAQLFFPQLLLYV